MAIRGAKRHQRLTAGDPRLGALNAQQKRSVSCFPFSVLLFLPVLACLVR